MLFIMIHHTLQVAFKMIHCLQVMPDLLYYSFKDAALLPPISVAESESPASTMLAELKSVEFSYEELAGATNDFNLSYKIGQGGFASVYYGVIRNQVSFSPSLIGRDST